MINRPYYTHFWQEFSREKELLLLSGPRQCGKTTLAKKIGDNYNSLYFNYDLSENKVLLAESPYFFQSVNRAKPGKPLIILDEIHKYADWKNYLKGIYDGFKDDYLFLVTGSGRLNLNRKKGDSLSGRHLLFTLFPFTIGEMASKDTNYEMEKLFSHPGAASLKSQELLEHMLVHSGFPEPFIKGKKTSYNRWKNNYFKQIIYDDIRSELAIRQIDQMETLFFLLPRYCGSPFSASNASSLLKVSHKTIISWMSIFEAFCLIFKVTPYYKNISRTITKEAKYYFYDPCLNKDPGIIFENLLAIELYRAVSNWTEYGLGAFTLHYIRNKEKKEVDFVVCRDSKPVFMIESKLSEEQPTRALQEFQQYLSIPAVQLIRTPGIYRKFKNNHNYIIVQSAASWLRNLS